jgi:hypothetical protein
MYPDFLVIGAQKAGTTWLDRNLRCHPQIWLPPEKEIHYFDLPRPLPFAALLLAPLRTARHWAKARLERDWAKVKAGEQSLGWYLRYYFLPRTKYWYRSLFTPAPGQICGESTPRYAPLPEQIVARIHQMMPRAKIVYILRDPIDRMWSDLAMFQRPRFGGRGLQQATAAEVSSFLRHRPNLQHSLYAENIAHWEKLFDRSQLCFIFQDDIATHPDRVLRTVTDFLGVPPAPSCADTLHRQINSKKYPPADRSTERFLASGLLDDLHTLTKRLPNEHTERWLERAERLMADDMPSCQPAPLT